MVAEAAEEEGVLAALAAADPLPADADEDALLQSMEAGLKAARKQPRRRRPPSPNCDQVLTEAAAIEAALAEALAANGPRGQSLVATVSLRCIFFYSKYAKCCGAVTCCRPE